MGELEPISLDDYTTLPGNSGATHSISLCIALGQSTSMDDLSCALMGNTLYQQDREFMLAKRANESFDSLVRLIHDTGVTCNLQSYPTRTMLPCPALSQSERYGTRASIRKFILASLS